jgi:hypothetical protein
VREAEGGGEVQSGREIRDWRGKSGGQERRGALLESTLDLEGKGVEEINDAGGGTTRARSYGRGRVLSRAQVCGRTRKSAGVCTRSRWIPRARAVRDVSDRARGVSSEARACMERSVVAWRMRSYSSAWVLGWPLGGREPAGTCRGRAAQRLRVGLELETAAAPIR